MAYVFEVNGVLYKYCVNVVSAFRREDWGWVRTAFVSFLVEFLQAVCYTGHKTSRNRSTMWGCKVCLFMRLLQSV